MTTHLPFYDCPEILNGVQVSGICRPVLKEWHIVILEPLLRVFSNVAQCAVLHEGGVMCQKTGKWLTLHYKAFDTIIREAAQHH